MMPVSFYLQALKMRQGSYADLAKRLVAPCLDEEEVLRIKEENVANGLKLGDKAFSVMDYINSQPPAFIDVTGGTKEKAK